MLKYIVLHLQASEMDRLNMSAVRLRRIELVVLAIGILIALISLMWDSQGAFKVNMGDSTGVERIEIFLLTLFAFLFMGLVLISPYALLYILGKLIAGKGNANLYQVAGLVISCLVTIATIYLHMDAHQSVSQSRSSTAGLVFIAVPVILAIAGGLPYFILALIYSRTQKRNDAKQ